LTYSTQGGRILCVCSTDGGAGIASGSENGSLHLWRVDYAPRRGGRHAPVGTPVAAAAAGERGAVTCVRRWGAYTLLYTTQHGGLHAWDTRMKGDAWTLRAAPREGMVAHLAADAAAGAPGAAARGLQAWLLTGTLRGRCTLWDMRFRIPVQGWQHPTGGIEAMEAAAAPPGQLGLPPSGGAAGVASPAGPAAGAQPALVYIAAGHNEIGLWDAAAGRCVQVLRSVPAGELAAGSEPGMPAALTPPRPHPRGNPLDVASLARHLRTAELASPPQRFPGVRSLLATGAGALLAGSSDAAIRLWAPAQLSSSYLVVAQPPPPCSAPLTDEDSEASAPSVAYQYSQRMVAGVPVAEEAAVPHGDDCGAAAADGASGEWSGSNAIRRRQMANIAHKDAVTALAQVEGLDRLLVSGAQDGTVKVWK